MRATLLWTLDWYLSHRSTKEAPLAENYPFRAGISELFVNVFDRIAF